MRILLVDQFGEMGGAQRCLVEAAQGFRERGWELHMAAPEGPLQDALKPHCAAVRTLPCGPFTSTRKSAGDALRFLGQLPRQVAIISAMAGRVDAIYVNGPRVLPSAALGRRGRPIIYHVHWMPPQPSATALARAALRVSQASAILASQAGGAWLDGAVEPARITTIYNGVAGPKRPPRHRDEVVQIAMLGRISPEKGQLTFARAARKISQRVRGIRFTICGAPMFDSEPGNRYFDEVRSAAAGVPMDFPGWTEDIATFLDRVDLLTVPSDQTDNAPRVILEAFAAGVPVLAFPSGAIPELVQHGETGILVHERTPEALAEAILWAVARPGLLNEIAARAYRRWQECYTLSRFQSGICDAVEAATRRRHQRRPLNSAGANAPA